MALSAEVAKLFRTALRRCGWQHGPAPPFVVLQPTPGGLSLSARLNEMWLRLEVPGEHEGRIRAFTADTLDRMDETGVTSEVNPSTLPAFPDLPEMSVGSPSLIEALREATRSTAKYATRHALHRVLLRGREGLVVGGDGKQLLAWSVGELPWSGDALVCRTDLWSWAGLPRAPVSVGRTHVFVRVGAWTVALEVDATGKVPPFEPLLVTRGDTLRLDAGDARTLRRWLRDADDVVTLELADLVRVTDSHDRCLTLPLSAWSGQASRVGTDTKMLKRVLELGFTIITVRDPLRPLVCRDEHRHFVWVSADIPKSVTPEEEAMSDTNGVKAGSDPPTVTDVLTDAEALRSLLRDADTRLTRLIGALKQQRKQAKAVQAAVATLRQLPPLTPD